MSTPVNGQPAVPAQPAPAPAALTKDEKINNAINKLSLSALDNKWIDDVESKTGLARILGMISYVFFGKLFNALSIGSYEDKEAVAATIHEFNNATVELANAVAARALTPEEVAQSNIAGLDNLIGGTQQEALANKDRADKAEKAFYAVFRKRVTELKVDENSPEFGEYAVAAQKLIESRAEALIDKDGKKAGQVKAESTVQNFNGRILDDVVTTYAKKPLAEITVENFTQKVADLNSLFPALVKDKDQNLIEVEAKLRQAIKANYDDKAFEKIRGEYTDDSLKAKRFLAIKGRLVPELKAEEKKLKAELKKLCGDRYEDATSDLHKAYVALDKATKEKEKAKAEYVVAITKLAADVNGLDGDDLIEYGTRILANGEIDGEINIGLITKNVAEYKVKVADYNAKKKAYDELEANRDKIAGAGNVSGRLKEITDILISGLDAAAKKQMNKMARFYAELSYAVKDGDVNNKEARSKGLHEIIDVKKK